MPNVTRLQTHARIRAVFDAERSHQQAEAEYASRIGLSPARHLTAITALDRAEARLLAPVLIINYAEQTRCPQCNADTEWTDLPDGSQVHVCNGPDAHRFLACPEDHAHGC